ncbi:MAG: hypothetical protein ACFFCU_13865, partial [Promethearchaeota archaeon]
MSFFFLIYSSIKEEKNFALDVYRYLNRRYPKTVVVDYGGLASDPIIQSRDAGPFKLIEVKVVTKKVTDRSDRDLILRGEVNPEKISNAELVVAIPSYNEADSVAFPVQQADRGIESFFADRQSVIINCDNNSDDGTKEIFLSIRT